MTTSRSISKVAGSERAAERQAGYVLGGDSVVIGCAISFQRAESEACEGDMDVEALPGLYEVFEE